MFLMLYSDIVILNIRIITCIMYLKQYNHECIKRKKLRPIQQYGVRINKQTGTLYRHSKTIYTQHYLHFCLHSSGD